jgi:serine/threonine-protein kinase
VTAPEPARRRRGFPWKLTLGVLVAAALVVLGVLASQLFATPVYIVPDLAGMPRAEALNQIAPNDWVVEEASEPSDVVPSVDHVVRTTPAAGSELAEGEPFLIVVSTGPVPRELSESTGETLADAQTRLIDRDLQVSVVEQFDEDVAPGIVVSWAVPSDPTLTAGSTVPPETLVELVVSKGPEPRVVPEVVGVAGAQARRAIEELTLVFVEGPQEFNDEVPIGSVIRQEPAAGVEVERGTTVTVVISRGVDLVQFPDLSGAATYEDAAVLLLDAGFEPRLRFGDAQGAIRDVTIDGEEPEVGETFRRGTVVDISAL